MRRSGARLFAGALVFVILLASAPTTPAGSLLEGRVIDRTLDNGMRVLLVERPAVPTVSYNIAFRVGSVNERAGESGLAHLFEHMAFKGTTTLGTKDFERERPLLDEMDRLAVEIQREEDRGAAADADRLASLRKRFDAVQDEARALVVPNELGVIYDRQGGVGFNASTGVEVTRYTVSLPTNRLPLWVAIESDRMARPVFREFYTERSVVLEERRLRVDDNPMGKLYETFLATAFLAHPYRVPTIGWAADVEHLTAPVAREFFDRYYGPGNAVVAIVGDIKADDVLRRVSAAFGSLPARPTPPPVVTREPAQDGERRVEVEYDAEPQILIGYHQPEINDPDDPVFDVIESLLSSGRTSRLYTGLVKTRQVAVAASASTGEPGARYPNLFVLQATPRAPHTLDEVESALLAEVDRLQREDVPPRELEKVINRLDADLIRSLQSNSGLASQLAYYEAVAGDWRYLLRIRDRMAAVTPADVRRVASARLTKRDRTVARLVRPTTAPVAP
ncbi:MAG: insulinase family protein [Nitrospirae bacterium]|nr:insulinase family protein [Nitrospirota bacterium]